MPGAGRIQTCIRSVAAFAIVTLPFCATDARASPCFSDAPQAVAHGSSRDERTIRLPDGRNLRLTGLEQLTLTDDAKASARRALDAILGGRALALHAAGEPDRYGRIAAVIGLSGTDETLQETLVRDGHFAAGFTASDACTRRLQALEFEARNARRGIWTEATALKNTETTGDILAMMGRFIVAEGKVLSARQAGATFYVNFGRRWTRDFAVTIARRDIPAFEKAGLSRLTLEWQTVRVRGWVVDQRGSPRIQATRPVQIEIVRTK